MIGVKNKNLIQMSDRQSSHVPFMDESRYTEV